jgi:hypothetical protein
MPAIATDKQGDLPVDLLPPLVFRIGFAGARELPGGEPSARALANHLQSIMTSARRALVNLRRTSDLYAPVPPTLRLVTGLADGADQLAARSLLRLTDQGATNEELPTCRIELASILPFHRQAFRASLSDAGAQQFDELAAKCEYVIEVEGSSARPSPDTLQAKARRTRAHRVQSQLLLHQVDLLVAVTDLSKVGQGGGTLETAQAALAMGMRVILVDVSEWASSNPADVPPRTWILHGRDDPGAAVLREPLTDAQLVEQLGLAISSIVSFPMETAARPSHSDTAAPDSYAHQLIAEFAGVPIRGSRGPVGFGGSVIRGLRQALWTFPFRHAFNEQSASRGTTTDTAALPLIKQQVERAKELVGAASIQYRSAFLLNYSGAVLAVLLAAVALLLLGHVGGRDGVVLTLFLIAIAKCAILLVLAANTLEARKLAWGRRAAHWRYFRERLRALEYLPRVGCFRAVGTRSMQLASRVTMESPTDWLFAAITRSQSPAGSLSKSDAHAAPTSTAKPAWLRVDLTTALPLIREAWATKQRDFHQRSSSRNRRLAHGAEFTAECVNWLVVGLVAIDLGFLSVELFHGAPSSPSVLVGLLMLLTAALPAAVASIHGFRSQSECEQLAKRYGLMEALLGGSTPSGPGGHIAVLASIERDMNGPLRANQAWEGEALAAAVALAQDFVDEVADWTVMNAKGVPAI